MVSSESFGASVYVGNARGSVFGGGSRFEVVDLCPPCHDDREKVAEANRVEGESFVNAFRRIAPWAAVIVIALVAVVAVVGTVNYLRGH